jgi:PST family polysaccharide transporter
MAPADYGLIALSMAVILILIAASRLGLEKLLVQLDTVGATEADTAFFFSLLLGSLLSALLWLAAPSLAGLVETPELQPVMRALAPVVFLKALEVVPLGLMIRELNFKVVAMRTLMALFAGGIAGIAMALKGYGVWALVSQEIVKAVCSLIALWLACEWRPGFSTSARAGRKMLAVSAHLMGSEMTRIAQNHLDRFLIGGFLGASSLGIYTVAAKVNQAAVFILHDSLGRVGLPIFSSARHDRPRMTSLFFQSQRIGAALTLPVFILLILTAQSLVPLILGPQWQASVPVLQALCLASCAHSIGVFNGPLLLAIGRPDIVFRLSILSVITGVITCIVALPWGLVAVSLAFALRAWLILPLELVLCERYSKIPTRPVWTALVRQLLALAPMVLVVLGFQSLSAQWQPWPAMLTSLALGVVSYVVALIITDRELAYRLLTVPAMLLARER